jgi:hypothetical protein
VKPNVLEFCCRSTMSTHSASCKASAVGPRGLRGQQQFRVIPRGEEAQIASPMLCLECLSHATAQVLCSGLLLSVPIGRVDRS